MNPITKVWEHVLRAWPLSAREAERIAERRASNPMTTRVLETYSATPPADRQQWRMSSATARDLAGEEEDLVWEIDHPPARLIVMGLPVVIDDSADGMQLERAGAGDPALDLGGQQ